MVSGQCIIRRYLSPFVSSFIFRNRKKKISLFMSIHKIIHIGSIKVHTKVFLSIYFDIVRLRIA